MSDRLTRKEMKQQDVFTQSMGTAVEYVQVNRRLVFGALAGVVLLAVFVVGVIAWIAHRTSAANELLARGIAIWQAPVDATAPTPDDPTRPSFATADARQTAAKAAFTELRDRYGMTEAADAASLYLAQIALGEGDTGTARKLWEGFLDDHGDAIPAAGVRLSLLELDRAEGKLEEVEKELRRLLETPEKELPDDVVLFQLGDVLAAQNRTEDAQQVFQRVVDEFPESPYLTDARRRAGQGAPMPITLGS